MASKIVTLHNDDKTENLLPRTRLKALCDDAGNYVSGDLTAAELNQLHGKTLVTANQQTLTDAEKAQARQNINAAAPDGYYGDSGGVYQYSTNFLGKNALTAVKDLVYRPTASVMSGTAWSADSIGGNTAAIEKIKGKTLTFNQILQNGNFTSYSGWTLNNGGAGGSSFTIENGILTISFRPEVCDCRHYLAYTEIGEKCLFIADLKLSDANANISLWDNNRSKGTMAQHTTEWQTVFHFTTRATIGGTTAFCIRNSGGTECTVQAKNCMAFSLTKMFGAGNEPVTAEEFRAMFPQDYYAYNERELLNFNGTGLQTVGFNQLAPDGTINVIGGMTYRIEGAYTSLVDSEGNAVTVTDNEFTPERNDTYTMVGGSCVHLKWSGVRDGDTEDYWQRQLALPIAQYFPDGMKSAGAVYDELTKDKAIQRIGSRDYQEGDEDDATVVTDGTTTLYVLETPVITPVSPELNLTYKVDDFGTEKLLPENTATPVTTPMDADIVYQLDYEANVRNNDRINISKASMDNFIASFNASGLGTITQVWDEQSKQYEYTVTAPQPTEGGETV